MSLELGQLIAHLQGVAAELREHRRDREEELRQALSLYPRLGEAKVGGRSTWLTPGIEEGVACHPLPPCPQDYSVLATDGSHIPPEPHNPIPCYLINLGLAYISYGHSPGAWLESHPHLYYKEEDLSLSAPAGGREEALEGVLLGIKRSLEEIKLLTRLMMAAPSPCLGLVDGSLIFWGLAGRAFSSFVREELLGKELLPCLGQLKEKGAAVAGYISAPHATEVVNLLRLVLCPHPVPDCDHHCRGLGKDRPCQAVAGIEDRHLFASLLQIGERSPLFSSHSTVVVNHYSGHHICFFYLRVQDEVVRVEVPRWLAQDRERLELVHSLIFDQCRRGGGYPVALMEAHEQAVLSPGDRETFWNLMEESLAQEKLPLADSAKRRSKRVPWV